MRPTRSSWSGLTARVAVPFALAVAAFFAPSAAHGQIVMSLPTQTAAPGNTISLTVNLTVAGTQLDSLHGNGIGADSFVISYNSTLSSAVATPSLGTLISTPSYGFASYTTNNTAGLIRAVTSSSVGTPGLSAGTSGTLASILFTVSSSAAPGTYTLSLLPSSGPTTTSVVDNNFNTYSSTSGLTLVNGSLTVTPVPEPGGMLLASVAATGLAGGVWRRTRLSGRLSSTQA
jgi:Cohesin domain